MPLPDNFEIYTLTVEDIRRVVEEEGRDSLTDEEIQQVADKIENYIPWYDAIVMTLNDCIPHRCQREQKDKD